MKSKRRCALKVIHVSRCLFNRAMLKPPRWGGQVKLVRRIGFGGGTFDCFEYQYPDGRTKRLCGLHAALEKVYWPDGGPKARIAVAGGAHHFTVDDGKRAEEALEEWLRRFTDDPTVLPESCLDPNIVGACTILRELDLVFVASQLICYSGTLGAVCTAADFVLRRRAKKNELLLVELKLASENRWKASDGVMMRAPLDAVPVTYENMAYVQALVTCEIMKKEYKRKNVKPVVLCVHAPLVASLRNIPELLADLGEAVIYRIALGVGAGLLRSGPRAAPSARLEVDPSLLPAAPPLLKRKAEEEATAPAPRPLKKPCIVVSDSDSETTEII
jgi:hypothetical protein